MKHAYFVTGTDTGIGKTLIATALLHKAGESGLTTLGLKPVAAGGIDKAGEFVNEDAWQLKELSSSQPAYADVNPVALRAGIAPHIAAVQENRKLDIAELARHCRDLASTNEFSVVEGAGGWCVPLTEHETMVDLAVAIGFPVILVVGVRLGCINHTLLSVAAIEASGLSLAGWVANQVDPDMPAVDENIQTLRERLAAPLLGRIPYLTEKSLPTVSGCLTLDPLL